MLKTFVQLIGKQDFGKAGRNRKQRVKMVGIREGDMKGKYEDTGGKGKAVGKNPT